MKILKETTGEKIFIVELTESEVTSLLAGQAKTSHDEIIKYAKENDLRYDLNCNENFQLFTKLREALDLPTNYI